MVFRLITSVFVRNTLVLGVITVLFVAYTLFFGENTVVVGVKYGGVFVT